MLFSFVPFVIALLLLFIVFVWSRFDRELRIGQLYEKHGSTVGGTACILGAVAVIGFDIAATLDRDDRHDACQARCGSQVVLACDHLQVGKATAVEQPWYSVCATADGGAELRVSDKKAGE